MKSTIDRRTLLRSAGIALALPMLESMIGCDRPAERDRFGGTRPASSPFPKRFVALFSPNGTENTYATWTPGGGESDFELREILAPLEPHRSELLILSGISNVASYTGPGDAHQRGMGALLTGRPLLEGKFVGNDGQAAGYASGISVDQEIAKVHGRSTKLSSLELSVQNTGVTVYARLSYKGPNQPLPPENDPAAVFTRLFGDFGAKQEDVERLVATRRSVLDSVLGEYKALSARVPASDRARLERHAEAIRSIEVRLGAISEQGNAACKKPAPPAIAFMEAANFPAVAKLQIDLLVMALACDLTRVSTLQFLRANVNHVYGFLGITDGHHDLSHHADSDTVANAKLTAINRWYAEQFAYLIASLRAIPEGPGTMLENCLLFWGNEQGKGNNHSRRSMPFVLAGKAGGALRTGRHLRYREVPHNDLLVSFLNAFEIEATTFGDPRYCTGPLAGLGG
jgi:hypothetical protein